MKEPPARRLSPEDDDDDTIPSRNLSRTPQPYLLHRLSISNSTTSPVQEDLSELDRDAARPFVHGVGSCRFTQLPSDSGTEADDESSSGMKALPAPPVRPRKGLRHGTEDASGESFSPPRTPKETKECDGNEPDYFTRSATQRRFSDESLAAAATEKFLRRRRAEFFRRSSEVAALTLLILSIFWKARGESGIQLNRSGLSTYVLTLGAVYALYPCRIVLNSSKPWWPLLSKLRDSIRVPSAYDPATLLYPILLPVLVSLSLNPRNLDVVMSNIVLGLSSLPRRIVPPRNASEPTPSFHWILTLLPIVAKDHYLNSESDLGMDSKRLLHENHQQSELLSVLFPLHQSLLNPLAYLTGTSLLPSELQLLSVSLINLFLFATSPHAVILRILLWDGGLTLFVLCRPVIVWSVTLARIPRWRFRRAGRVVQARNAFLNKLLESIGVRRKVRTKSPDDTDTEDETSPKVTNNRPLLKLDLTSRYQIRVSDDEAESKSAVESNRKSHFFLQHDAKDVTRLRRNTLPDMNRSPSPKEPVRNKRPRRSGSVFRPFLSLTSEEAGRRKWTYACYVYAVIIATILGPIRLWVQNDALNGHEPFGWAIGYLFGNIRALRFSVVNWDLEYWIPLPPLAPDVPDELSVGFAEKLRIGYGAANVRLAMSGYLLSILTVGLTVVLQFSTAIEVDTRRKVFHGTMVAMFLPAIYVDPSFCALALGLVLAIFLLLDLLRASQLPPLSKPIAAFLTPYVDGRDLRGPVVVSHLFLLIGCAIPLWLSLAGRETDGEAPWKDWEVDGRDLSMISGVVCVGLGDAAASLVGRRFGRTKWPWAGGKSIEGSVAFAVVVVSGLALGEAWLDFGGWNPPSGVDWAAWAPKAIVAASAASFTEAVLTGGNDNVIVPVVLWLWVRALCL